MIRVLLLVLLVHAGCAGIDPGGASSTKGEMQFDEFTKRNSCGGVNTSRIPVLSLSFTLPRAEREEGALTFEVSDRRSRSRQIVSYESGVFSYKEMFGKAVHQELNSPVCDARACRFELYAFIHDWTDAKEYFDIRLGVRGATGHERHIDFPPIRNSTREHLVAPYPQFLVTFDEHARIVVPAESIQRLGRLRATDAEIVLQWKEADPLRYLERSQVLDLTRSGEVELREPLPRATYVAGMLMYKVGAVAFEVKIEVKNDTDKFYECKQNR